jgi:putative DNA primase/helicase
MAARRGPSKRRVDAAVAAILKEAEAQAKAAGWSVESLPEDAETDDALAFLPQTDLGNAERFAKRFSGRAMHVAAIGWFYWDGRRWSREGAEDRVLRFAHQTARAIQGEATAIRGTDLDQAVAEKRDGKPVMLSDKLAAWGLASEAAAKLTAMVKHGAPYMSVEPKELDNDPWKINVENGTLSVDHKAAGDEDPIILKPHDPADRITKLAPVVYDQDATCGRYDRFLEDVQPDAASRRFLHQWGGYSLTGDIEQQKLVFSYGKGRNGKSTLVDIWGTVAGDYSEIIPIETFVDQGRGRNAGAATPDLAILPGVRMLRTSEPEKNSKLAEALIKLVTGGEPIQARHLNQNYFKFRPSFKLTMSGNYRPSISGTDEGIWRRVVLVPWRVTVEKPEPHLLAQLRLESSGILNRLLDGLRDYLDAGLLIPEEVAEATQDYREDSDPLGRFLAAAVEAAPGERTASRRMHEVFASWAKVAGEREWSSKGLAMALKERGFRSMHSNGMWWLDCRLMKSEVDFGGPTSREGAAEDDEK